MHLACDMDAKLQETYLKLQHELSLAEEKLKKAHSQGKLLEADRKTLDKGIAKANNSIKVGLHGILWMWSLESMYVQRP